LHNPIFSTNFFIFFSPRLQNNIFESVIFLPLQASCATGTGGLAQAGQWLARKFVRIWKFYARPSGSGSPACAKPLGRCRQAGDSAANNEVEN